MKWPRGRFNGMRIVGAEIKIVIDFTDWSVWLLWRKYVKGFALGPLRIWFDPAYKK